MHRKVVITVGKFVEMMIEEQSGWTWIRMGFLKKWVIWEPSNLFISQTVVVLNPSWLI